MKALRERGTRQGRWQEFWKSRPIIIESAKKGEFLSYKELADASGADWNQVYYQIGPHLWQLVEYSHRKGQPILSAIVVNKPNVATGKMEPDTLKGFISAAKELGYEVTNEEVFLKQQQDRVFAWARADDN